MIYDYVCWNGCRRVEVNVSVLSAERDKQKCPVCKETLIRLSHFSTVAVVIPVHMRATGDDMIRQIMPGQQEADEEGRDVRDVRREWLRDAQTAGATPRYRQDLEG